MSSSEEAHLRAEHILAEQISGSDRVEHLTATATTIHQLLGRLTSDELIDKLLSKYRSVQLRISALQEAAGHLILAINALDRAIIVVGHDEDLLELVEVLERRYQSTGAPGVNRFSPNMCFDFIGIKAIVAGLPLPKVASLTLEAFGKVSGFPFLVESFAKKWPACHSWQNPIYFLEYHHRLVPIEIGTSYHDSDWRQAIIPFGDFLGMFIERSSRTRLVYLAQYDLISQFPKLAKDVPSPQLLESLSSVVYRNLWFGMTGCYTPLHRDPYDNFFVQLVGRKQFILVAPCALSAKWANQDRARGISMVLHDLANLSISFYSIVLSPGNMLFIPRGWWHAVESLSDNISISFWV